MSKRDDVQKYYTWSSIIKKIVSYSFIINAIGALLSIITSERFLLITIVVQLIATFVNIVLGWIDDNIIFPNAERTRRKSNIDNSFDINTTIDMTDGYYNNKLSPSVEKFLLNNFESIYFTINIAKKMVLNEAIKVLISLSVLFIAFNVFAGTEMLLLIFQLVFSGTYILGLASLLIFISQINRLYEDFYHSLITENHYSDKKTIRLLSLSAEYEIIKGSHRIKLSSKIFNQLNPTLSSQWDSLQKESLFYKSGRKNETQY
ncbi:hypothetical protein [Alkalibacterium olivapovliticus]|uniref:Uncharacterized protein n=1 Tax=Alkalibacterium olivapovliticus TaxID=99907 RepID=A0A2T0W8V7_9LACT|nr:hypothetical protein [Alkalibacterium olivapovliticus]PRY83128.1 hypothetical protein CLV38_10633 [Alkalibacterium olivapovliticus]